jgi:hypothetical protein
MVSAARAFEKERPKQPLTSAKAIAADFKWRYKKRKKTDQVVAYCAEAKDFAQAVRRAVESRDAAGKHHNHQSKVDLTARRKFGAKIIKRKKEIKRLVKYLDHEPPKNKEDAAWMPDAFDMIHDLLDEIKPYGIGPVTVYDVATRIGAFLGVEPTKVYMHAGVRQGLKALESVLPLNAQLLGAHKLHRVPMYLFPKPFNKMKADDVEDILCTYREVFLEWPSAE